MRFILGFILVTLMCGTGTAYAMDGRSRRRFSRHLLTDQARGSINLFPSLSQLFPNVGDLNTLIRRDRVTAHASRQREEMYYVVEVDLNIQHFLDITGIAPWAFREELWRGIPTRKIYLEVVGAGDGFIFRPGDMIVSATDLAKKTRYQRHNTRIDFPVVDYVIDPPRVPKMHVPEWRANVFRWMPWIPYVNYNNPVILKSKDQLHLEYPLDMSALANDLGTKLEDFALSKLNTLRLPAEVASDDYATFLSPDRRELTLHRVSHNHQETVLMTPNGILIGKLAREGNILGR